LPPSLGWSLGWSHHPGDNCPPDFDGPKGGLTTLGTIARQFLMVPRVVSSPWGPLPASFKWSPEWSYHPGDHCPPGFDGPQSGLTTLGTIARHFLMVTRVVSPPRGPLPTSFRCSPEWSYHPGDHCLPVFDGPQSGLTTLGTIACQFLMVPRVVSPPWGPLSASLKWSPEWSHHPGVHCPPVLNGPQSGLTTLGIIARQFLMVPRVVSSPWKPLPASF
jgi:hypothetical protein